MKPHAISWMSILDCTERGPRPSMANVVKVLQTDPTLGSHTLYYDPFTDRVTIANSPTRSWVDEDDYRLTVYLQQTIGMISVNDSVVSKAVRLVASQRPRHSVTEWLDTLTWDGVTRLETAFEDYWGVDDFRSHPQDYVRAVSRNFILGLVARVIHPGCKLDTMPVFEGAQGALKSSALEVLASPLWFATARDTVGTKDFLMTTRGKLIIEIAELDAFSRAEITAIKNTMSTAVDTYRPPYGRTARDYPRQCVFAGTTNKDDWATDPTGGRRFWPVKCGVINLAALAAVRSQLFAESLVRIRAGEDWWLTPDSTTDVQRDRHADDVWTDTVLTWLIGKSDATSADILLGALKFRESDIGRSEQNRIGNILRHAGWKRQAIRRNGAVLKAWTIPNSNQDNDVTEFKT